MKLNKQQHKLAAAVRSGALVGAVAVCTPAQALEFENGDWLGEKIMKVSASVKKRCPKCKIIKRKGVVRVICVDPNHKQRQG